ncbi:hypothetical protein [uncultured Methanobrevibacter sp.]|uniref:hypothetical protein n=1 Tax=uncultured Methanobrevibacter sp. TaxID=253161 RepID=UPI0025FF52D4|nr:hypothetical protein [uncultured Methanobrevibacter sp.]
MLNIKIKLIIAVTLILGLFLALGLVSASDVSMDDYTNIKDNNNNLEITTNNNINENNDKDFGNDNVNDNVEGVNPTTPSNNRESIKDKTATLDSLIQNNTITSQSSTVSKTSTSAKKNLKIVNHTNFVKNGNEYHLYLRDANNKGIDNKTLYINFNGKTYKKTTANKGAFSILINSNNPIETMDITFKGDSKYNKFTKTLTFYVDPSTALVVGNKKVLTDGFLRIYLTNTKKSVANKTIKISIENKKYTKKTSAEGFVVFKPKLSVGTHNIVVQYGKYVLIKAVNCIKGTVLNPLEKVIPTINGVPNIDVMPGHYVMANPSGKYTLTKEQYKLTIQLDSYYLFLYNKLSKYTTFKTKACPTINHIIQREKWNVIERALNVMLVKKNKKTYWPSSITVSLAGKAYTYCEVRDVQNTEYTCGPTSASVCSQALRNYYSEYYFQKKAHVVSGVNIPVLKKAIEDTGFAAEYFYTDSFNSALKKLGKGGCALIAYLPNHYVSIIDISKDGKKILVSNSYGKYNEGGKNKVPTGWVSLKYFKTKFAGVGLTVKLNYKIKNKKVIQRVKNMYLTMGSNWIRQNTKEKLLDTK